MSIKTAIILTIITLCAVGDPANKEMGTRITSMIAKGINASRNLLKGVVFMILLGLILENFLYDLTSKQQ